ncbi:MAG: P-II family nitrogen regulator [Dehalococcoidia bacterium]
MIKVEAVVRPEKVNQVLNALQEAGCGGFHYGNVTGQGKQQGVEVFTGRGGQLVNRSAMPKTVITTVIADDKKDAVVNAILESARTNGGSVGDGKIFISRVDEAIRVSTGETGEIAISKA